MVNPSFAFLGQSLFAFDVQSYICCSWSILHFLLFVNPTFSLLGQFYICFSWPILNLLFLVNPTFALLGQSYICSRWSILHLLFRSILYLLFAIENPWGRILTSMVYRSFGSSLPNHLKTIQGSGVYFVIIEFLAPSSAR